MKPALTIIGCGTLGRTLGLLWQKSQHFEIQHLYSRTLNSTKTAQDFIGAGLVSSSFAELTESNVYLISTTDDQIETAATQLATSTLIRDGDFVFHCSGALSSDVLLALKDQGAYIASAHPIKSFTDEQSASTSFAGTYCTIEGDEKAVEYLSQSFRAIGAQPMAISKEHKVLYHASTTLICNYLCALMDIGFDWLEKSGLEREIAMQAVMPLATETLSNLFKKDTAEALTGPIARGDADTLKKQLKAVSEFSPNHRELFIALSRQAMEIANKKTSPPDLAKIRALLS